MLIGWTERLLLEADTASFTVGYRGSIALRGRALPGAVVHVG